jgi:hypothetical protein
MVRQKAAVSGGFRPSRGDKRRHPATPADRPNGADLSRTCPFGAAGEGRPVSRVPGTYARTRTTAGAGELREVAVPAPTRELPGRHRAYLTASGCSVMVAHEPALEAPAGIWLPRDELDLDLERGAVMLDALRRYRADRWGQPDLGLEFEKPPPDEPAS